jgi:hypothetical protein
MTLEDKPHNKRIRGFLASPVGLIRLSSLLFAGLTIGHLSAYPWRSVHVPEQIRLVESMKSVAFVFLGERSSYWNLYFGWGLLVAVLLLTLAMILWFLSDVASLAPRGVGVIVGIIAASCLAGAYISLRFFYIPPFLFNVVISVILLAAMVQLLRQPLANNQEE